jgi:pimeloyl-ACP methyl ester carboxylesterase
MPAPIILVPGFWLGAWAYDEVAATLRADGHDVTALTLPGLESADTDRSAITFADHVDAIVSAVRAAGTPVVLAVHSGTGFTGYAASDVVPDLIATMVYVDTAPGKGVLSPELEGDEEPMSIEKLKANESFDGVSEAQMDEFARRGVGEPAGVMRGEHEFTNEARRDIPSTIIATAFSAADYQKYAKENPDWAFLAGIGDLRDITWIDLPTSHWPMWSKPTELAAIIGDVATNAGGNR